MKRSVVLLVACLALAGGTWLTRIVFAQSGETKPAETKPAEAQPADQEYKITKSRLDKYVAGKVAEAVAAERERAAKEKPAAAGAVTDDQLQKLVAAEVAKAMAAAHAAPVTDDQVLRGDNWHKAIYEQMEFVVYTGPGQAMEHHWIPKKTPGASTPASKSVTPSTTPAATAPKN